MGGDTFQDDGLVLAAHGSTVNADSSVPVRRLVDQLERRSLFARVAAGLWKEEPPLSGIVQQMTNPRVFVVPFFISEGYFTEERVPLELGFRREGQTDFDRVQKRGGRLLFYCRPVGTHDLMTEVILSRARTVVEAHPFPRLPPAREITLFIAGHGTERNARSRESVEHHAHLIRSRGIYADVRTAFMEEEPKIQDCLRSVTTRFVVMVPFFLSDGLHVAEDIPVLLGEPARLVRERLTQGQPTWRNPTEQESRLVWYSAAVGTDPIISEVILERVREAAQWPVGSV